MVLTEGAGSEDDRRWCLVVGAPVRPSRDELDRLAGFDAPLPMFGSNPQAPDRVAIVVVMMTV